MRITFTKFPFAATLAVAAMLAGCSEPPAPAPALQSTAPLNAAVYSKAETHTMVIGVDGRATTLETDRLHAFIADLAGDRPESLHVTIGGAWSAAQLRGAKDMLIADGVDPAKIAVAPAPAGGPPSTQVTLAVTRYIATPPACNPWGASDSFAAPIDTNTPHTDIGCSDLSNLGAMVADPHDLVKGASDPYANGTTAATAVQRYESDRLKPFPDLNGFTSTPSSGSGSSGSSGGM